MPLLLTLFLLITSTVYVLEVKHLPYTSHFKEFSYSFPHANVFLPAAVSIPSLINPSEITFNVGPSRYSLNIFFTIIACSELITRLPSSSFVYPKNLL